MYTPRRLHLLLSLSVLCSVVVLGRSSAGAATPVAAACPWTTPSIVESHQPATLAQMVRAHLSLDQAASLLALQTNATAENVLPAIPALCLPSIVLQDGPDGVTATGGLSLPSQLAVGASFDPAAAASQGHALGVAALQRGIAGVQAPGLNLLVEPGWGRGSETYGEDPTLATSLGIAEVRALQATGTMAIIKHAGVYAQELDRRKLHLNVDPRAVAEIYLAPVMNLLRAGADPAGVMCAYGSVNGVAQCEDDGLVDAMRAAGFTGFVRTDLAASANPAAALNAGVDLLKPMTAAQIVADVTSRQVPAATVLDAATILLTELFQRGAFSHPRVAATAAVPSTTAEITAATNVAEEGAVLLRDQHHLLPLDAAPSSIAVIGPAATAAWGLTESGSAGTTITDPTTIPDALAARFPGATVSTVPAVSSNPVVPLALADSQSTAAPILVHDAVSYRVDHPAAVLLSSTVTAASATVTLGVDGRQLRTGQVLDGTGQRQLSVLVHLAPGIHSIEVTWSSSGVAPVVTTQVVDDAVAAAAQAAAKVQLPIVVVGTNDVEGVDHASLALPGDQDALVEAALSANPNTVVVLETGGPVLLPWLAQASAVLELWHSGQEAGPALAALLSGDVSPSGHLPVTFPLSDQQSPLADPTWSTNAAGTASLGGSGSAALAAGQHYYDAHHLAVQFPFGFGLSYTSFALSHLSLTSAGSALSAKVVVTNTGNRAGRCVVQGYLTAPAAASEPANRLVAFTSAQVAPGAATTVTLGIAASQLTSYLHGGWTVVGGTYQLRVGLSGAASSPLAATFQR